MRHLLFLFLILFAFSVQAHTYKCKDKTGNWTEQACPDYEHRKQQEDRKSAQQIELKNWEPKIGMSASEIGGIIKADQCRSTRAFKWCGYHKVNITKSSKEKREQWVFTNVNGMPLWYLYFENDILVYMQE